MVCRGLVDDDDQLTGKCYMIDKTVLLAEKATSGEVEMLCLPEAICDLVVKNVPLPGTRMILT